ncbi:hypothetical protein MJM59_33680, partial [Salmonella enterica subsp. enterica serovar Montevideo]|nr:hypothetical protein [Salmonella enterica subsp. enterica serovar Montevideo]
TQLARTGNATQLDLRMAEIALRSAEINRAAYTRQLARDRNALIRDALTLLAIPSVYLSNRDSVFETLEAQEMLWVLQAVMAP